jgi:hypothetical protein
MKSADSCWKAVQGYSKLGTLGMIKKGKDLGFSRQDLADVFGVDFVIEALGEVEGETLQGYTWR